MNTLYLLILFLLIFNSVIFQLLGVSDLNASKRKTAHGVARSFLGVNTYSLFVFFVSFPYYIAFDNKAQIFLYSFGYNALMQSIC